MKSDLEKLNKIPNINQGGCDIVALGLKRKYGGEIVKLIAGFLSQMAHVALKKGNKIIDSTGLKDKSCLSGYSEIKEISESELITTIKNEKQWVKSFDRKHISNIEEILDVNLNDIK